MTNKNDALLQRLLVTFRVEADEHLEAMAAGLLALEKTPSGAQAASVIETIFREAHSLLAPLSFHKQRGARDNAVLMGVNYCLIDPFAIAEIVGVDNKLFHLLDYLPLNKSLGYLNCVKRRSLQQVVRDNPEREAIVG